MNMNALLCYRDGTGFCTMAIRVKTISISRDPIEVPGEVPWGSFEPGPETRVSVEGVLVDSQYPDESVVDVSGLDRAELPDAPDGVRGLLPPAERDGDH